ncbi:MAG: GntR family transcriptional regulator [Longimicrobiales bacterium]
MVLTIDPNDVRPIYIQIMDEIRRALVVGSLRADEPLPSVRQLAADLRVNPNTVQQSYRELEREGVVYVRRGQGTYAASLPEGRARERRTLAAEVAQRAVRDAYRHGLDAEELVTAIREAAPARARSSSGGGER